MNNDNLLQLEGAIESVVFRNDENGYTVIELADGDDYLTAVGIMPQVSSGDVVKLTGKYTNHPSYGRQFAVQICEISRPTEAADILRYLSSGAIKGIGTQTAQRLVKEFGEATLDVLENQPERVAMLKGISSQKAEDFSNQLKQNTGVRTLMLFLGEYGISFNRTTGISPLSIRSPSTLPGPTEGSWSESPTRISLQPVESALITLSIMNASTIETSSTINASHFN